MSDIDDLIRDDEEREMGANRSQSASKDVGYAGDVDDPKESQSIPNEQIGTVEKFFSNINVAAICLTGTLRVGDMIGIEKDGEIVRTKVYGMQIDRKEVEIATEGDSIGIKVDREFKPGSAVYLYA